MEDWKQLPGFSSYWFHPSGDIYGCILNRNMVGSVCDRGYIQVSLRDDSGKKHVIRHHLILAKLFIPNPGNCPVVDHINRNKLDNRISNLRWATKSENTLNADQVGRPRTKYSHTVE